MEERINKLEELLIQQDNTIAELNHEVFRQQQDITVLRRRIELLETKIAEIKPSDEIAGNEKPPHW